MSFSLKNFLPKVLETQDNRFKYTLICEELAQLMTFTFWIWRQQIKCDYLLFSLFFPLNQLIRVCGSQSQIPCVCTCRPTDPDYLKCPHSHATKIHWPKKNAPTLKHYLCQLERWVISSEPPNPKIETTQIIFEIFSDNSMQVYPHRCMGIPFCHVKDVNEVLTI